MLNKTLNVPSTMVAARVKSCDIVLSALGTSGPQMAGNLGGKYSPHLEDGQVMPFETQLQLFEKELIRLRDQMVEAERRNRDQKVRETLTRTRRDADVQQVNAKVARVRRILSGAYQDDQSAEAGLARRNARDSDVLLEQATTLVTKLERSDLALRESQLGDFEVDAPKLAQGLKPATDRLRQSVDELVHEVRQSEATLIAKDRAMAEFNHGFLWIARSVESLLQLAELEEEAARVRPSSRRPGVTERLETSEDDGDQPAADGDSGEPVSEDPSSEPVPVTEPVSEAP
jgi:hypothetical protein